MVYREMPIQPMVCGSVAMEFSRELRFCPELLGLAGEVLSVASSAVGVPDEKQVWCWLLRFCAGSSCSNFSKSHPQGPHRLQESHIREVAGKLVAAFTERSWLKPIGLHV